MTNRERLLNVVLWLLVGGLFLGTSAGRASLVGPVNVGVMAPLWAVWSTAALTYFASLLLPWRAARVAIAFVVMHAFLPPPIGNPLPWSLIQEAGVFLLVLLSDLAFLPPRSDGPDRPRRTPAAALRNLFYSITTAAQERRRISRAS